ncbi:MAG: hypothetical protein V1735_07360 [Nanoarchaeota archaeon]
MTAYAPMLETILGMHRAIGLNGFSVNLQFPEGGYASFSLERDLRRHYSASLNPMDQQPLAPEGRQGYPDGYEERFCKAVAEIFTPPSPGDELYQALGQQGQTGTWTDA